MKYYIIIFVSRYLNWKETSIIFNVYKPFSLQLPMSRKSTCVNLKGQDHFCFSLKKKYPAQNNTFFLWRKIKITPHEFIIISYIIIVFGITDIFHIVIAIFVRKQIPRLAHDPYPYTKTRSYPPNFKLQRRNTILLLGSRIKNPNNDD